MAPTRKSGVNNSALLEAALEGLQLQRERIEGQIAEVRRMIGKRGGTAAKSQPAPAAAATRSKRKPLSAAARKRIAAAQKRRWADFHAKQKKG